MASAENGVSGVKTLLLTDMPPCSNWTAGIVTAQMCSAFAPGTLCVFAVLNPEVDPHPHPDLRDLPTLFFSQPNEDYSAGNLRYGNWSDDEIFAAETAVRTEDIPRLIRAAVKFAQTLQVEQVWAVLQGQTMVRMALAVAEALNVPLKSQIWDPFSWWQLARNLDPQTCVIDNELLAKTLRASELVIAPSKAMAGEIKSQYGVPSQAIITSIAASVAQPPALGLRRDSVLTIGIAGQFYARDAWLAFYEALDSCGWSIGGRSIIVNVYGSGPPPNSVDPDRVKLCGWLPQPVLVKTLASECDICYCPYPFDPKMEEVSRLSFPSKLVVYLASGRPILFHGPSYSSPSKYLEENDAGICVHVMDAASIIASIEQLVNDRSLYSATAKRGAQAFMTDFTLDTLHKLVREHLSLGTSKRSSKSSASLQSSEADLAGRLFDPYFYWNSYRGARKFIDGIANHYFTEGWQQRLNPHPLFCVDSYLMARPDVAVGELEPLAHYLSNGWKEGADPHPLFSIEYYLGTRGDVAAAGIEPLMHYISDGWKEGSDPHPLFSASHYMARRPDAVASGTDPLTHYLTTGWKENTDPHPLFSVAHYLAARPDVAAAGMEPLSHYLRSGWREGSDPHPLFSVRHYLAQRPDIVASRSEPLAHYLSQGWRENTDPHPLFSVANYFDFRPDVAAAGVEPLMHYLQVGWGERTPLSTWFSTDFYRESYPETTASAVEPLTHYLIHGWREGFDPNPWFSTTYYIHNNPDVDFGTEAPLFHYINTGWKEWRDPNPWFSIRDYRSRLGIENTNFEPVTHFLKYGEPLVRQGPVMTMTAQFIRNYRNTVALRQSTRENERLRSQIATATQVPPPRCDFANMDPRQRCLTLVENILTDVGTRVTNDLEMGGIDDETQFRVWCLLHSITRTADSWLRAELAQE